MRIPLVLLAAVVALLGLVSAPSALAASAGRGVTSGGLTWQAPQHVDPLRGLTSVSCVSKTLCRAGDTTDQVLRWNGHHWLKGYQFPSGATGIDDVSCTSADFCAAVEIVNTADGTAYRPVTRDADGTWDTSAPSTLITRGRYDTATSFTDGALSCTSASFCMLANQQNQFQQWDGSSWSTPVDFETDHVATLVSCASASVCRAVEDSAGTKNYYAWDGTTWSRSGHVAIAEHVDGLSCPTTSFCMSIIGPDFVTLSGSQVSSPRRFARARLVFSGLSCTSARFCLATGNTSAASIRWTGSGWTSPHAIQGQSGLLVSCASGAFCAAVSAQGDAVHRVDGTWQAPRVVEQVSGLPEDVSCGSPQLCLLTDALGASLAFGGTSWSGPHLIKPHRPRATVSCVSASFCAAGTSPGNVQFRRNGHWSAPEKAVTGHADIEKISCSSTSLCAATTTDRVLRVWNGNRWSTVANPRQNAPSTALSCVSDGCVLVAPTNVPNSARTDRTWIYRPGAKKLVQVGGLTANFDSLSCVSLTFCMGDDYGSTVQQFDGSTWRTAPTASGPIAGPSVSCASSTFCVAVLNLSESTWDGSQWSSFQQIVDAPVGADDSFEAVSCLPSVCAATTYDGWTVVAQ